MGWTAVIGQTNGDGPERSAKRFGTAMRLMAEAYPDVLEKSGRMQLLGSVYEGTEVIVNFVEVRDG
jgi:hypothetical protein